MASPSTPEESALPAMLATLPEGKIVDFIDGTLRSKTAEEYVRQNFERSLVQEYRYPREDIAVEFSIKVGSARKRVDLVVFAEGAQPRQESVRVIIECKQEGTKPTDRKEGVEQLLSYMAASINCEFGVWTNGSDERLCFRKEEVEGQYRFAEIVDIPAKGQEGRDTDVPDRFSLRPASGDNLLLAFRRCHNYIAGNQGLQKPEAFWELLKLIFCKIEDERSLDSLAFYVTTKEMRSADGQLRAKKRMARLFITVKRKYGSIFKINDDVELNVSALAYCVSQLQGFSLLDSQVDVKGVAYEEIVGSNLRGDRGEFFTPRNACSMAVDLLDPGPEDRFIDPACGTGGFLVTAMNHVLRKLDIALRRRWRDPERPTEREIAEFVRARQDVMGTNVVGLDINPNLVRAAKMNMVMNNDGSGGLTQADSLKDPVTWSGEARDLARLGSFDFVFTNPPFGTRIRIDNPDTLAQYDLGAAWEVDEHGDWKKRLDLNGRVILQGSQPPEILFIERCVQFLKPGTGQMAIVVPNGILNNPPLGYVRRWLLDNTQLLAIIDMQRDLFQPRNDTQTSMVVLRRLSDVERAQPRDYPIFMAVADKIGHDKRGNPIFKRDLDGTDILVERRSRVKTVEAGNVVEQEIVETVPEIDDQLPEIGPLFREWVQSHGLGNGSNH